MIDHLYLLTTYGYFALFSLLFLGILGIPLPDELLLVYAGFKASHGAMALRWTFVAGAAGCMCGITLSYLIGRHVGLRAIQRFGRVLHVTDEHLLTVRRWFQRWGKWTLVVGCFVPGMRHAVVIVSGTSGLTWRAFAPYAYSGACIWSSTFVLTGYVVGPETPKLAGILHQYLSAISGAVAVLLSLVLCVRYLVLRRRVTRPISARSGDSDRI